MIEAEHPLQGSVDRVALIQDPASWEGAMSQLSAIRTAIAERATRLSAARDRQPAALAFPDPHHAAAAATPALAAALAAAPGSVSGGASGGMSGGCSAPSPRRAPLRTCPPPRCWMRWRRNAAGKSEIGANRPPICCRCWIWSPRPRLCANWRKNWAAARAPTSPPRSMRNCADASPSRTHPQRRFRHAS